MAATAIVVPVAAAEAVVGRWRRAHTKDGAEGMPAHVTLIHPFVELIDAIAARFPEYPPFGGAHATVIPHLTVAYAEEAGMLAAAEEDVSRSLPVHARIGQVDLMEPHGAGGWRVHRAFPL